MTGMYRQEMAPRPHILEEIVENVTDDVVKYKTSVVLLHDGTDKSATVEALGPLIEALEEWAHKYYRLMKIHRLFSM